MFDIRYHVASLVAVFLALGLGILIGSTVNLYYGHYSSLLV